MTDSASHRSDDYGTSLSLRLTRAASAGAAAGLAADQVGLNGQEALVVGAVASGWTAATDLAGVAAIRRRLRRAASPKELAYRQAVRLWLLDLQRGVEKPPDQEPPDKWLAAKGRDFEATIEEYMAEAADFDDDVLEVALRQLRDALVRQRDFDTGAGRLPRLIAEALIATNLTEQGVEVIREQGVWDWLSHPFRRRRSKQEGPETG